MNEPQEGVGISPKKYAPKDALLSLVGQWAVILTIGLVQVHCTWTPEIETLLYQDQNGTIALQTTQSFKTPPNHPTSISDSLIQ